MKMWIFQPDGLLPYSRMVAPYAHGQPTSTPNLFKGNASDSVIAVRDALMNYNKLMEQYPDTVYTPKPAETAAKEDGPEVKSEEKPAEPKPEEKPEPKPAEPKPVEARKPEEKPSQGDN
jgi:hypothetical protein